MEISAAVELISSLGFPIACVLGLAWFVVYIVKESRKTYESNMEKIQANCKEREEKLYKEIAENREINKEAIKTIAMYAERLDKIQNDVSDIKTDMIVIKTKVE